MGEGFEPISINEDFAAFIRQQGHEPGREFQLNTPLHLAQLTIFKGQIAFSIPYSQRAAASIEICARIARSVASECELGYYDPHEGVVDC